MDMPQPKRNENRYFCRYGNGVRVANRLSGVSDLIRPQAAGQSPDGYEPRFALISFVDAIPASEVNVSSAAWQPKKALRPEKQNRAVPW